MKRYLIPSFFSLAILANVSAQQVYYEEDFEQWPLTEPLLTGSPFFEITGPGGDIWNIHVWMVESVGEGGVVIEEKRGNKAMLRQLEMFNNWYGGGFFSDIYEVNLPGGDMSEYTFSFSLRAETFNVIGEPDSLGGVGASVFAFDASDNIIGSRYKAVSVLTEWKDYSFSLAEMAPGNGQNTNDFSTNAVKIQVIFWIRNFVDGELGWPATDEGKIVRVWLDNIKFTGPAGGGSPTPVSLWKDYPKVNQLKHTEFGWIYDAAYPFVFSFNLANKYPNQLGAGWMYIFPEGASLTDGYFSYDFAGDKFLWNALSYGPYFIQFNDSGYTFLDLSE